MTIKKWSLVKPSQTRLFTHKTLAELSVISVTVQVFRKIIVGVKVHRLRKKNYNFTNYLNKLYAAGG